MITKIMYKLSLPVLLIGMIVISVVSCKKYNDWKVDDSYDRLFRPTAFQASVDQVTVKLRWKSMPQTSAYTIQLSKDSLVFGEIVETYTGVNSKDADGYLLTISGLDPLTQYSARIKGEDTLGIPESEWSAVAFKTTTEQILYPIEAGDFTSSEVTIKWAVPNEVTHLLVGGVKYDITPSEKEAGLKMVSGLMPKTNYEVAIYNNTLIRGQASFRTTALIPTGPNVVVLDEDSDLSELLPNAEPGAIFVLLEGSVYSYDEGITLKDGASFTIWGEEGAIMPVFACNGITLPENGGTIKFENIDLSGYQDGDITKSKRSYIFNQSAITNTEKVIFENCVVRNLVNTPFRMQGSNPITVDSLIFNRCTVYDIGVNTGGNGTYAFISSNVATGKINNIVLTNSTFYSVGYGLILHNSAPSESVIIENCTFNNIVGNGRYFIDYNGQSIGSFTIRNNIIGKTLSPANPSTARGIRAATVPTVINAYKTSDAAFSNNAIPSIIDYTGASTDLFTDPDNGNFLIKDNTFLGKSDAGDPRWRP